MTTRMMYTLSAFAVAGMAAFQLQRLLRTWRRTHLNFDFPLEDYPLFVGGSGTVPKRTR